MNSNRASIVANRTVEGVSVIDIILYNANGQGYNRASKGFIDDINAIPGIDREKIKSIISRKYGIPSNNISFD